MRVYSLMNKQRAQNGISSPNQLPDPRHMENAYA